MDEYQALTRRRLFELGLAVPVPLMLAACSGEADSREAGETSAPPGSRAPDTTTLAPTPPCNSDDEPTPEQTAGPFFIPDSPERVSLVEAGVEGTPLLVRGVVLATDCTPIPGALLDFWHADAGGTYDTEGFRLRGHQFADRRGRYRLETIVPGRYTGRTRHIHVNVQAPDSPVLTTQLYFPGEPANASDAIFDPALVMRVGEAGAGRTARFDFVLDVG